MTPGSLGTVVVTPTAFGAIRNEYSVVNDGLETGGILLGCVAGSAALVRHAGDPGPSAIRRRNYFLRDLDHAQGLADAAFRADGSVWIGEWHSHVEAPPIPSRRDLTTYAQLLGDQELGFDIIIALIVGDVGGGPLLTAWGCTPVQVIELPIIIADPDRR